MLTEKQFEEMLLQRRFEAPSLGFSERIIARAEDRGSNGFAKVMDYLRESVIVVLPQRRPVYALAFILVIGLLIGSSLPPVNVRQQIATTVADEEVL